MMDNDKAESSVHRIGRGGYLHRLVPIVDRSGKVIHRTLKPLMVELRARDLFQIVIGASILAIPVGFTEETWSLGERLPLANVFALGLISVLTIAIFVYFNFYRFYFRQYTFEYVKRVTAVYLISLSVVAVLLTLIQQCPWSTDAVLAIKRIVIVAFPAALGATITDAIK